MVSRVGRRAGRGGGSAGPGGQRRCRRGSRPPPGTGRAAAATVTAGSRTPAASTWASQAAARRPSPTASRPPTSARTMLWQNASAVTVATGQPGRGPRPLQAQQLAHGARALAPPAERGEVVLAEADPGRLVHRRHVDRPRVPERVVPAQRIGRGRVVADPVGVAPPERGEPGVEPVRGGADRPHPDVGRQQPGQRAGRRSGRPPPRPPPARRRGRPGRARAPRRRSGRPRSAAAALPAAPAPGPAPRASTSCTVRRPGWRPSRGSLSRRRTGPA